MKASLLPSTPIHSVGEEVGNASTGDDFAENVAAARLGDPEDTIHFLGAIPILRIFDEAKAREFYCGFLGFSVDFEHRFGAALPLYMQVSRAGLQLHLSEHHGDASPGSTVFVPVQDVRPLWQELSDKHYSYGRPGIETQPWGDVLTVHDPFGNRLRFCQQRTDY